MDSKELEELERLEKAATPGPWNDANTEPNEMCPDSGEMCGTCDGVSANLYLIAGPYGDALEDEQPDADVKSTALVVALRNNAKDLISAARKWEQVKLMVINMAFGNVDDNVTCGEIQRQFGCSVASLIEKDDS